MTTRDVSLFDVEDLTEMPKVRDMTIGPASVADAQEFAARYHYSGHASNQSWRYGLWYGAVLLGFVGYNLPTRETCASLFGVEQVSNVAHLSRLALAEHAPRNSESRLIAGSLKALARDEPHLWAVVTYADILAGHVGYVYQATNAIYTGVGSKGHARYVLPNGDVRGDYEGAKFISQTQAKGRGWEVIEGQGKHRYVYILGNRRQRRERLASLLLPTLPYPKCLPLDGVA